LSATRKPRSRVARWIIAFDSETGGREQSGNYLIDNSRVVQEFGMQFRPYRERVLQIINEVRAEEGKPPVSDR
jgi:predicted N-formylglutamate amidohydrolase